MDECKPLADGGPAAPHRRGMAVQVDPFKPTLKAPGTERLKLKHDEPLSDFAFNFKLRRYTEDMERSSSEILKKLEDLRAKIA